MKERKRDKVEPHDTDTKSPSSPKTGIPGKEVRADQLVIGDVLLNDDGSVDSVVEEVYLDPEGLWLDTGDSMGYVNPYTKYRVETYNSL